VFLMFLVFFVSFLLIALVLTALSASQAETAKKTVSRLNVAVGASERAEKDEIIDVRKREKLSAIPVLNKLLANMELGSRLRKLLAQADSTWTPGMVVLLTVAIWLGSVFLITLKINSLLVACLLALIPAAAPIGYLRFARERRFRKFEEGLPAALDLMVSGLRAGHSIVSALELVGRDSPDPIGKEFRLCFDEQNYGLELRDALENLAKRMPLPDVQLIKTAILVQKETGGNLAEVLEKCAHLIRERFRLKREIRIKTAQGRLTGWILSLLPPGLGLLLYLVHPEVISLLWLRPMGVKLLWTGTIMTVTGALIIRKIVRIRV
jgi:tight adherence protein B